MLELTSSNYFSPEANWQYMSVSQFKSFAKCESAAMAELRGEWTRPPSNALLVGSYIDAYFSNEMDELIQEHPEMFKKDGSLKSEFLHAQKVAERLERDELARLLLSGENQVIKTGQIAGVWYKAKFDSLLSPEQVEAICKKFPKIRELVPFGGAIIVDLKYMRDLESTWSDDDQTYITFIEKWGYDTQGAVYQELDGRIAPFVIVAATKEAESNIEIMYIPDDDLEICLDEVKEKSPRYAAIKRGEIEPIGCGKCEYCRSVKKLDSIKHYRLV